MDTRIAGYAVAGLIFGAIMFANGFKNMRRKKLMESLPTSKIRSLAIGIAEIYGQVAPYKDRLVKSPFSHRKCVCSRYTIEEYNRFSKYGGNWHKVKDGIFGTMFHVQDETGSVVVNPDGAHLDLPITFESYSGIGDSPSPEIMEFLKKTNIGHKSWGINKSMRFRESIIRPGDKLYVLGRADDNPFVEDGTAEHGTADLMMQKSKNPKAYYLSDRSEKQIIGKLNGKILGQIVGGPLLIGGCLAVIFLTLSGFMNFGQ